MEYIILPVLIGLIPAAIARSKGRSFIGWWLYGALIFIVALPHSILAQSKLENIEARQLGEGMKKCPECAELVKRDARVCRFCGHSFSSTAS